MKNKTVIFLFLGAMFIFFIGLSSLLAEEFRVIHSISGLEDLSRFEEGDDVNVDFSGLTSEEEKAKKVCEVALKNEVEKKEEGGSEVILMLKRIRRKDGNWYLDYSWQYESEYNRNKNLNQSFKAKVDLKGNLIIYERNKENYYSS